MQFHRRTVGLMFCRSNAILAVGSRRSSNSTAIQLSRSFLTYSPHPAGPESIMPNEQIIMGHIVARSLTHPPDKVGHAATDECSVEPVAIVEELFAQTILLRNLYQIARWQICNGELCRMHQLFEAHYKKQL